MFDAAVARYSAITVTGRLDELAETAPGSRCFQMGEMQRTYAQTQTRSIEVARGLSGVGVSAGDRVATLAPNRAELIELLFGISRLGAIQVP